MPQAAISPILASTPVTAVAGANPQVSDRNASRDTASAGMGGFADALKRQLGAQTDGASTAAAQAGAASTADAAPPVDGASVQAYIPTDLATLLASLVDRAPFSGARQDSSPAGAVAPLATDAVIPLAIDTEPPLATNAVIPLATGTASPLAAGITTPQAASIPDASGMEGVGDMASLPASAVDKHAVHGTRNSLAPLASAANKKDELASRPLVQAREPLPVQTPAPADNGAAAAQAQVATMSGTSDTPPYKGSADAPATPATEAASTVAGQLLAAATLPVAGIAVAPTPPTPLSGRAITPELAPAKTVATPVGQNAPSVTAGGNKAPATADFAAVDKPVPGTLPSAMGSPTDSKNITADAQTDNFQTALAASGAQQALDHARMADSMARDQVISTRVATPLGTPGWSEDVGNKLVWMAGADHQQADLVLTPPNMGRIEVSITVKNEQATANFVAANSEVRDALEQSLPRLREMFANVGISLGQANVSGESSAGQQSGRENRGRRYAGVDGVAAASPMAPAPRSRVGNGMVDTFV